MRRTRRLAVVVILLGTLALAGCFLFPNRAPIADFTVSYPDPSKPLLVLLDASTSSDPDGDEIVDYMWTANGAGTITEITTMDITATVHVPQITIEFDVADEYEVTLAVRDARGKVSVPVTKTVDAPQVE